jgi:sugar phosphate isomerase/epimerase
MTGLFSPIDLAPMKAIPRLIVNLACLIGLGATLPAARAEANPFFVFDNGLRGGNLKTIAAQLDLVKELGFAGLSWRTDSPEHVKEVLDGAKQRGLKIFVVYVNLDLKDGKLAYDPRVNEIITLLKGTDTILCPNLTSKQFARSSPTGDDIAVAGLRELADLCAANGLRIAIYPHVDMWVHRIEDALRVVKKVGRKNVGLTFNLCHAMADGAEDRIPALIDEAAPWLFAVLINGADSHPPSLTWERLIQPLDKGSYDVGIVLKRLKAVGYQGPVGLQCFNIKGEPGEFLRGSMAAWRRLSGAPSPVDQVKASDATTSRCPYPPSEFITGCTIDPKVISYPDHVDRPGDNWPVTWAADGKSYTFFSDGSGFGPLKKWRSTHPALLWGNPGDGSFQGEDIATERPGSQAGGEGTGKKVSGLIAVPDPGNAGGELLVAWVRNASRQGGASVMISKDHGSQWAWVWGDPDHDRHAIIPELGHPSWVQSGKGNASAPDEFLYFCSQDNPSAYQLSDHALLGRVHREAVLDRARYEYFCGMEGRPAWSKNIADRKPAFIAKGQCYRLNITYNLALKRYLLLTSIGGGGISGHKGTHDLGIYESEHPWGPWRTVYWDDRFHPDSGVFAPQIVPTWISEDGKTCWLLYSCYPKGPYKFNLQRLALTTTAVRTEPIRSNQGN